VLWFPDSYPKTDVSTINSFYSYFGFLHRTSLKVMI